VRGIRKKRDWRETDREREKENEEVRKTEKGKCEIDGR